MYNLLIVEDEEEIREGVRNCLETQMDCYKIYTAKNGLKALEILNEFTMHIILLDMRMPVMDGITFLKEIKKLNISAMVIVLSGFEEFKYAYAAIEYGVVKYLLKPLTPEELIYVVTEMKVVLDQRATLSMEADFIREYIKKSINEKEEDKLKPQPMNLTNIDNAMPSMYELKDGREMRRVEKVKKIIDLNYQMDLNAEFLSKAMFINKDYFGRIFKLSTGFSFNDYLNRVRVAKAKDKLIEGRYKIYEIAEQVGFSDEHYFSTVFKKITGKSPSEYK